MGNSEEAKSTKADTPSSPVVADQANQNAQMNVHVYHDWAAMQAYYGPRMPMPPYYNSAMASGHPTHPYMWGPPQPMMPPYGAPYAAIYSSHGGVYAHAGVPLGPQSHGQGIPSSPVVATPHILETPTKSSGHTDQGVVKKLKGFDALVMTVGSNAENGGGAEHRVSHSFDTEASSDGSDGHTSGAKKIKRKRSREGTPSTDRKADTHTSSYSEKEGTTPAKATNVDASAVIGRPVVLPGMTGAQKLQNVSLVHANPSPASVAQSCAMVPSDTWTQNEKEMKRERRKQSNRESARRSRLRKQAEAEELARKVECLTSENVTLKSEINRLTANSENIRAENATLLEKLNNAQPGHTGDLVFNRIENKDTPRSTENLLSRVNNSTSNDRAGDEDGGVYQKKPNSGAKLRQLLDASPRADAVAAS